MVFLVWIVFCFDGATDSIWRKAPILSFHCLWPSINYLKCFAMTNKFFMMSEGLRQTHYAYVNISIGSRRVLQSKMISTSLGKWNCSLDRTIIVTIHICFPLLFLSVCVFVFPLRSEVFQFTLCQWCFCSKHKKKMLKENAHSTEWLLIN